MSGHTEKNWRRRVAEVVGFATPVEEEEKRLSAALLLHKSTAKCVNTQEQAKNKTRHFYGNGRKHDLA